MATTAPPAQETRKATGKGLVALALVLAILGPILFTIQIQAKIMGNPMYGPILATLGLLLALYALKLKVNVWRIIVVVLCLALTGMQWYTTAVVFKTPDYAGPTKTGAPVPEFRATFADGSVFDQDKLKGDQNTVLVFFRGRW